MKGASYAENPVLFKPTKPDPLVDPIADHQIVSMMEGVVQQGTGIKVAAVGKPIAGKTGTSSDWFDAWFVGFSPDIAAGAFVGFDTPRTLGDGETGGNVAAPIFRDFMAAALKDAPALPFPDVPGADMVLVNSISGQPTSAGDKDAILEAFRPGTEPNSHYNGQQIASSHSSQDVAAADSDDATAPIPGMPMPGASGNTPYMATAPYMGTAPRAGVPVASVPMGGGPVVAGAIPAGSMGAGPMPNARLPRRCFRAWPDAGRLGGRPPHADDGHWRALLTGELLQPAEPGQHAPAVGAEIAAAVARPAIDRDARAPGVERDELDRDDVRKAQQRRVLDRATRRCRARRVGDDDDIRLAGQQPRPDSARRSAGTRNTGLGAAVAAQ